MTQLPDVHKSVYSSSHIVHITDFLDFLHEYCVVIVKSGGLKYMNFQKGIKLDFICMKMELMKNKKYLPKKCSRKVHVPQTTANFTSRVNKSYVPFTCKLLW